MPRVGLEQRITAFRSADVNCSWGIRNILLCLVWPAVWTWVESSVRRGFSFPNNSWYKFYFVLWSFSSSIRAGYIYSYSTTNKMHLLSQIIYSCKTLYMFRTVFSSVIRSTKLRVQQRYTSNSCCYLLQQVAAAVWHITLLYTQFWAPDDGRKDRPKHVEFLQE